MFFIFTWFSDLNDYLENSNFLFGKESKYTKAVRKKYPGAKSLKDKSKKSGIPLRYLRKVYNRGIGAWKKSHRPGTTPEQWANARVNSFLVKGKTYHTADSDIAKLIK